MLSCVVFLTGLACQPDAVPQTKNVKVTLVVILASEEPVHVDKQLVHIAKEVQKKRPELKCFKLKCMSAQSLPVNTPATFNLVDKQTAEVVILQPADAKNRVILGVKPPLQGKFEYETVCGKFLPIVTRYETQKDERLILAIRVQPCNGGK
jgi:hypothetical protein